MTMRYLADVVTLELDAERCTGCRVCAEVCPHAVFAVEDGPSPDEAASAREGGKARIVDRDACMECGACALNCPADALSVEAGVGCANAVIRGMLRGTEPTCGCSCDSSDGSSCCP